MSSNSIAIRPITNIADLSRVEAIQRDVWLLPDDLMVVPTHLLKAVADLGGVLLGAYNVDAEVVGFVFGFLAHHHGHYSHHSHMMGVLPGYQNLGIGRRLKLAQREAVLAQGLETITWTVDPLESRNAHLNVNKLGVVCNTYIRDMYGEMVDGLNVGLPSDRLLVEWHLRSRRVMQRLQQAVVAPSLDHALTEGALLVDPDGIADGSQSTASLSGSDRTNATLVQIPFDFQRLREDDPAGAIQWRLRTRSALESLFADGCVVTALVRSTGEGEPQAYYLLQRSGSAS